MQNEEDQFQSYFLLKQWRCFYISLCKYDVVIVVGGGGINILQVESVREKSKQLNFLLKSELHWHLYMFLLDIGPFSE